MDLMSKTTLIAVDYKINLSKCDSKRSSTIKYHLFRQFIKKAPSTTPTQSTNKQINQKCINYTDV